MQNQKVSAHLLAATVALRRRAALAQELRSNIDTLRSLVKRAAQPRPRPPAEGARSTHSATVRVDRARACPELRKLREAIALERSANEDALAALDAEAGQLEAELAGVNLAEPPRQPAVPRAEPAAPRAASVP